MRHFNDRRKGMIFQSKLPPWVRIFDLELDGRSFTQIYDEKWIRKIKLFIINSTFGISGLSWFWSKDQSWCFFCRILLYKCRRFDWQLDGRNQTSISPEVKVIISRWTKQFLEIAKHEDSDTMANKTAIQTTFFYQHELWTDTLMEEAKLVVEGKHEFQKDVNFFR